MSQLAKWAAVLSVLFPFAAFAQGGVFSSDGLPIHYIERGQGDPVVLIHPGNRGSKETWVSAGVFDALAKTFRVIAIDCRGFGMSGRPHDQKQYGRHMGLDVVRLLDHLNIRRAHIVGYSMGAAITAQLLTTHPDRFLTAILGGGAGRLTWTAADYERTDQAAAEWEQGRLGPAHYASTLENWPTDEPKPPADSIRQRGQATLNSPQFDRRAYAALLRSYRDHGYSAEQAIAVAVPTLGVAGTADPGLADLQVLKRLRPAVTLVVINGATHGGPRGAIARPEFLAAVRDFLGLNRAAEK